MDKHKFLKLDIQFFADKEEDTEKEETKLEDEEEVLEEEEKETSEEAEDEGKEEEPKESEEERVARLVAEQLEAIKKAEEAKAEEERKKKEQEELEKSGDYKKLAEELKAKVAEMEAKQLETQRITALVSAGYSKEQAEVLKNSLLEAKDEEAIEKAVKDLKTVIPVREYADPSKGRGRNPGGSGELKGEERGRSLYERLMNKK